MSKLYLHDFFSAYMSAFTKLIKKQFFIQRDLQCIQGPKYLFY